MNTIDDVIRKTLSAEDAELFERYAAEEPLHRQVLEMFHGRLRWISALGWIAGLALFAAGCYCWWRFAHAQDIRGMLLWAAGAGVAFLGLALVKVWFWLELQKNSLVREVKRLELAVANIAARLPR